jgi:hypothetical protein
MGGGFAQTSLMSRPLFIALRRAHFEAFASGQKTEEWRRHGPRWNAGTCIVGRSVIVSLGWRGRRRLTGVVTSYREAMAEGDAAAIYGMDVMCAVIGIALNDDECRDL